MARAQAINWQPISQIPLIASMIDGALDDTKRLMANLSEAKDKPHVLDDDTIDRVEKVHTERLEFIDIYEKQIARWRTEKPSTAQLMELDRLETRNQVLRKDTHEILALAAQLRKGTINRIMEMSDLELGLQALMNGGAFKPR